MQDQNEPYYLAHLISCTNRMLYYRDISTYLTQNKANPGNETTDKANGTIIDGNIGCLILTSGENSYGVEWVAASFKANAYLKEVRAAESSYVLIEPTDKNLICCHINVKKKIAEFSPLFPARHMSRTHDCEYLLLNFLGHLIILGQVPNSGRLSLITERIPCESCAGIMCDFADRFRGITLDLFYMHDTTERQPESFFSDIGKRDIRLIKVAYRIVVDLVEVTENPRLTVHSIAREQGKMFGGSPNQVLQAVRPSV